MATRTSKTKRVAPRKTKISPVETEVIEEVVVVDEQNPRSYRLWFLLILAALALSLLWYKTNTWPVAAFVNGKPVLRFTLDQQLYKQGGQQVLDSIITERLVNDELNKNKVTASKEEIAARINEIKTSLGTSFDAALAAQGMTMDQLESQVGTQIRIEKLLNDQASVSAEEVTAAMKENSLDASSAAKLLKQQKLQTIIQDWVEGLRTKAKVMIVGATPTVEQK